MIEGWTIYLQGSFGASQHTEIWRIKHILAHIVSNSSRQIHAKHTSKNCHLLEYRMSLIRHCLERRNTSDIQCNRFPERIGMFSEPQSKTEQDFDRLI